MIHTHTHRQLSSAATPGRHAALLPMCHPTILALLLLALPACGTSTGHSEIAARRASQQRSVATLGAPLTRRLSPAEVQGRLEGRLGSNEWVALVPGQAVSGLRALRAQGRGAMLTIPGDSAGRVAGKLWLQGGGLLHLGRAPNGTLRLRLQRGVARVSLFDAGLPAVLLEQGRDGAVVSRNISGRDLLLQVVSPGHSTMRSRTSVTPVALRPRAAEWTLSLMDPAPDAAAGFGSLTARSSSGGRGATLELRRVRVVAHTSGDMAETRVEHVFYNDSAEQLEGTFRFPLPEGAALTGLAMEIDGKLMEGELVERHKARRTYESIVDAMQDPALLEWEQGNVFKLRVFPIEPRGEKRLVLRYVAPLSRGQGTLTYHYPTAAAEQQRTIPSFTLTLDGKTIEKSTNFVPGRSISVPLPDTAAGVALREMRKDGIYTALRLQPDWSKIAPPPASNAPRDLLLLLDTSRSALESRELALQATRALLASLHPDDRFLVLATDLTVRPHAPRFTAAREAEIQRALGFVEQIEPDGASDLALALRSAGQQLARRTSAATRRAQVVYLGDGTATWGETDPARLVQLAAASLDRTPLHTVILGKGPDAQLLRRLAAAQGGRAIRPRDQRQVQRLALQLQSAATLPRLRQLRLRAGEHEQIYPRQVPTLLYGQQLTVLLRTPADKTPSRQVVLEGLAGERRFVQSFAAARVAPARYVAHRWAQARMRQLEQEQAPREQQVAHSLRYGVMCRHTAFLVLESEEAYRKHQIARKNGPKPTEAAATNKPSVSGGDLESLGQARAGLSPDHFQPGDPEVRIPAPADARSVVVVFPFGETKVARFEPQLGAWTVRFLVAQDTPDGTYQITVRITHRDGHVQLLHLSYVVDTRAPSVQLQLRKRRGRRLSYLVRARQIVTRHELVQEARRDRIAGNAVQLSDSAGLARYAQVVQDAVRVDLQLPGGKVLRLRPYAMGKFAAIWRPAAPLTAPVPLRVVAVDKAYNKRVFTVTFDPQSGEVSQ